MTEMLASALLDLLAPEIARIVDERLAVRLPEYEEVRQPDEWMTTQEAAVYLRLTPSALRARVRRGSVRAHDDNGRWLFRRSELDAELAATMTSGIHRDGASAAPTAPPPTTKECTFDA
jgi:excisionase family DNA binding protein